MESVLNRTDPLFTGLWHSTWQASVLICLVLLVQWLVGKKLSPGWRYSLWLLVLARLALPVTPQSAMSIFNIRLFEGFRVSTPAAQSHENLSTPPAVRPLQTTPIAPNATQEVPTAAPIAANTSQKSDRSAVARMIATWIPPIWLFGVLLQIARICWQNVHFARRVKDRVPVTKSDVVELLDECKRTMKVRLHVALFETSHVRSPALYGLFRPRLLLPQHLIESFSRQELRHILLHELAHVKRSDMVVNWLMTVLQTLHWFNPLVWFAFGRIRADRESACDALALTRANETDTRAYGATIIKLLEGFTRPATSPSLMGILEVQSQMRRRIRMIAHFRKPSHGSAWAVSLLLGLGLVGLTDARITEPATSTPVESLVVAEPPKIVPASTNVSGKVIDEETTEPIDAFKLFVRKRRAFTNGIERLEAEQIVPAGDGTNGEFHLPTYATWDSQIADDLEIRAKGYVTKRFDWPKAGDPSSVYALTRSKPIEGLLHFPDGRPAAGVEVALWTEAIPVVFDQTGFLNRHSSHITWTDAEGKFVFKPESEALRIIAMGEKGYAEGNVGATLPRQRLTLRPWGRVEGSLMVGKNPGKGEKVSLRRIGLQMFPHTVTADNSGEFVFERVPPGEYTFSRVVNGVFSSGNSGHAVRVRSSETTHVKLVGTGRQVIGRLTWTASGRKIDWQSRYCEVLFYSRTPPGILPVSLQSDGSFTIEDVPAGVYQLVVSLRERPADWTEPEPFVPVNPKGNPPLQPPVGVFPVGILVAALEKAVEVPVSAQKDDNVPLDVGTLEMKSVPSSLTSQTKK